MAERKKFIKVNVPLMRTEIQALGTPEELNKKTIKLDLSRKMRGKGLNVTFQIFNQEGSLIAAPKKMELVKSYISKMMRKRVDYVEDSFKAQCSDIRATVKPFLITRKRVSRAVRRNLRNTAREFIIEYMKDRTYNEMCEELMASTIQKEMLPKLKKVYPLSFCDIRVFETKELEKIDLSAIETVEESEEIEEQENEEETTEEVEEDSEENEETEEPED